MTDVRSNHEINEKTQSPAESGAGSLKLREQDCGKNLMTAETLSGKQADLKINPFEEQQEGCHWYAAKVFYNRTNAVCEKLESEGLKLYRQSLMPSYIFINCTENKILELREQLWEKMFIYYNVEKTKPYAIPEKEMTSFILVTSADFSQVMFLGEDKLEYHTGDLVRVKEGPFKGAEGHIKRIKRDRKIVVSINGVAAVALAYIPPQFLEPVTD